MNLESQINEIKRKLRYLSCETNFYESADDFPTKGKENRLYIDTSSNQIYTWDGTTYISVGSSGGGSIDKATQSDVNTGSNDTKYITPLTLNQSTQWNTKQDVLVSGTNIKTVNGNSILGSGDIDLIDDAIVDGELKAPSQNAVFDALAIRDSVATTGTVISFVQPQIYNTHTSPATGNVTDNLTGAKIGIVQKIYHNHSVEPTFPAGWVKLGPQVYVTSTLNIIYAEWVSGTRVEYWITQ